MRLLWWLSLSLVLDINGMPRLTEPRKFSTLHCIGADNSDWNNMVKVEHDYRRRTCRFRNVCIDKCARYSPQLRWNRCTHACATQRRKALIETVRTSSMSPCDEDADAEAMLGMRDHMSDQVSSFVSTIRDLDLR